MTRYLSISETITIYQRVMAQSGGMVGIRNMDGLHAAVAQPQMTFDGRDVYPTIADKAAALVLVFGTKVRKSLGSDKARWQCKAFHLVM
jgi:death-on-curing protein